MDYFTALHILARVLNWGCALGALFGAVAWSGYCWRRGYFARIIKNRSVGDIVSTGQTALLFTLIGAMIGQLAFMFPSLQRSLQGQGVGTRDLTVIEVPTYAVSGPIITQFPAIPVVNATKAQPFSIVSDSQNVIWFGYDSVPSGIGALKLQRDAEFPLAGVFPSSSGTGGITALAIGPDKQVWYIDASGTGIWRAAIDPQAVFNSLGVGRSSGATLFPFGEGTHSSFSIVAGPDDAMWFTDFSASKIGRITAQGKLIEYATPTPNAMPATITVGPDGALWFTETATGKIGRITTSGKIAEYSLPSRESFPYGITKGGDGSLWFTESASNRIGRITVAGAVTDLLIPTANAFPTNIAAAPDGSLWFTEYKGNKIGHVTMQDVITELPIYTQDSEPYGITVSPDGTVWFTEYSSGELGRIQPTDSAP